MAMKPKHVAILVEQFYEEMEVWYPLLRLREAGHKVSTVGPGRAPAYQGKHGYEVPEDLAIAKVKASQFDGVIVPGGYGTRALLLQKSGEKTNDARVIDGSYEDGSCVTLKGMPGAGLSGRWTGKEPPERPTLKPYWGKPAVRNLGEDSRKHGAVRVPYAGTSSTLRVTFGS